MIIATLRNFIRKPVILEENFKQLSTSSLRFDQSGSDNNDKKEVAAQKLNALLKSLIQDDLTGELKKDEVKIEIPKPRANFRKKQAAPKQEKKEETTLGEKIVEAAKEVAKVVQGDRKENEIQLLQKLLYKNTPLKDEITKASSSSLNLSELVAGMKVEKDVKSIKQSPERLVSRAAQVRNALGRRQGEIRQRSPVQAKPTREMEKVDLFGAKPLGIFNTVNLEKSEDFLLETWENCHNSELRLSVTHPPSNIYEQMIIWTERGILWKFPIDNEQGMEHEKQTYFADHVFLETHLEGWCPRSGPIRHFMELVCVGLSRNYWLTAEEKKQHIMWYKDYFSTKKEMIKEIGAGEIINEQPSSQL